MSRRVLVAALLACGVLGGAVALAHEGGDASHGATLYASNCLACHGPQGEARASGEAFSTSVTYTMTFEEVVAQGVADTYMGPWGEAHGGPLSDTDIADLSAYAQTWSTGEVPPLPTPEVPTGLETLGNGDPELGAALYMTNCFGCHGPQGEGRGLALYPPISLEADVLVAARRGVEGTLMPAFSSTYGGPLSEDDLNNVMAYVRTWKRPPAMQVAAEDSPEGAGMLILLIGIGAVATVGGIVLIRRG
jgi:mono/diheme cytochrome c family protein